jgi:hypothetical protein
MRVAPGIFDCIKWEAERGPPIIKLVADTLIDIITSIGFSIFLKKKQIFFFYKQN